MKITFKAFLVASFLFGGAFYGNAQTKEQREKIVSSYDLGKLDGLRIQFESDFLKNKNEALRMAEIKGWPVFLKSPRGFSELMSLNTDGSPMYFQVSNAGSALTSRVNLINTGGGLGLNLNGQNMIAGVWDGGAVRITHQDLAGRSIYKDGVEFVENTEGSDHGTHVSGTIISSGVGNASAKGMAYQATLWGSDWNSDLSEMVSQAQQGLLLSNHSYGLNADFVPLYYFGAYIGTSKNYDDIMYAAPYYQAVIAAGNDREDFADYNPKAGRDLLTGSSTSKNAIVVAAVSQVNNYINSSSVTMSSFSNWGPTDDGRIKPDISAKGVGVFSTIGNTNSSYGSKQGTSMAAPGITGSLLLLQQHYNETKSQFMKAATLRGLMIHTADEAGSFPGPDHRFGWGLMNAAKAAQVITESQTKSFIAELTLVAGQTYTKTVTADGVNPIKATICWTDASGAINTGTVDLTTPSLVVDLDLRVTKGSTVNMPWKLNSNFIQGAPLRDDNTVDNVEKVEVPTVETGNYVVTVSHKGLFTTPQDFSIIITGIDETLSNKEENFKNFSIYPNPTSGVFKLGFAENEIGGTYTTYLFDSLGKQIFQKEFSYGNLQDYNFDISQYPTGLYLLKVVQGDIVQTKRILKN